MRLHRRQPTRLPHPWDSPGKNTGGGCHFLLQSNAWKWKVKMKSLSHVQLLATPWTVPYQAPPSMGFSRQEYWSGLPLPSLIGFLTNPKTKFWGHFVQNAYQDCSESIIFSSVLAQYYYCMWPSLLRLLLLFLPFLWTAGNWGQGRCLIDLYMPHGIGTLSDKFL